jgi:hypothetical protein
LKKRCGTCSTRLGGELVGAPEVSRLESIPKSEGRVPNMK